MFEAPLTMLVTVPEAVPLRRATLAANMETALNAVWDAARRPATASSWSARGIVGLMVATLAARLPGAEVTLVDVGRRPPGAGRRPRRALRASRRRAGPTPTSSSTPRVSGAGLDTAIRCAGLEATVVELSWYGESPSTPASAAPSTAARLRLVSSQVGQVSALHRPRWSYAAASPRRSTCSPIRASTLVADEIAFADAAEALPRILAAPGGGPAPVIRYPAAG